MSDGSVVFGGNFVARDGSPIHRIARWNGCSWDGMGGGFENGTVKALCEFRGELIAAGNFTSASGTPTPGLARWDGAQWTALERVWSADVSTIVEWNNELLCLGLVRWDGGASAAFLAAWDGVRWREFDSRVGIGIDSVGVIGGVLTIIGYLSLADGVHVYQWRDGNWTPLGPAMGGSRDVSMAYWQGSPVVAGLIGFGGATVQNRIAHWRQDQWVDVFAPFPGGRPTVASDGEVLYAMQLRGAPLDQFARARVAFTRGGPWAGFDRPTIAVNPSSLALFNGGLLLDDYFAEPGGDLEPLHHGTDWLVLWRGQIDGRAMLLARPRTLRSYGEPVLLEVGTRGVRPTIAAPRPSLDGSGADSDVTFVRYRGQLVMGSRALTVDGANLGPLAIGGANGWEALGTFAPALNGAEPVVIAAAVVGDSLYVGGFFGGVDGVVSPNIIRFDGSEWHAVGTGTNNAVFSITEYAGAVALAGTFTQAGGVPVSRIALWDGQGYDSLQGGLDGLGTIRGQQLLVFGTDLYVRGAFQRAGGIDAQALARWDGTSWRDCGVQAQPGNPLSPTVTSLAHFNQGLLVQGSFSTADGVGTRAVWDGTTWSPLPIDSLPGGSFGLLVVPGDPDDGLWAWSINNMALGSAGSAWLARYGVAPPEHRADLSGSSDPTDPGYGEPDGVLDMADFLYFIDRAVAGDARAADLTGDSDPFSPCYGTPDGRIDVNDLFYFLDRFVE